MQRRHIFEPSLRQTSFVVNLMFQCNLSNRQTYFRYLDFIHRQVCPHNYEPSQNSKEYQSRWSLTSQQCEYGVYVYLYSLQLSHIVLTMQTVLLNLFQLVIQTLFIRNQPPQPLLGILQRMMKLHQEKNSKNNHILLNYFRIKAY